MEKLFWWQNCHICWATNLLWYNTHQRIEGAERGNQITRILLVEDDKCIVTAKDEDNIKAIIELS